VARGKRKRGAPVLLCVRTMDCGAPPTSRTLYNGFERKRASQNRNLFISLSRQDIKPQVKNTAAEVKFPYKNLRCAWKRREKYELKPT
jgi:hypothetical protein